MVLTFTMLQGEFRPTLGADLNSLAPNLCRQGPMISAADAPRTDCNGVS
jgi:hypothetical protein